MIAGGRGLGFCGDLQTRADCATVFVAFMGDNPSCDGQGLPLVSASCKPANPSSYDIFERFALHSRRLYPRKRRSQYDFGTPLRSSPEDPASCGFLLPAAIVGGST